MSLKAGIYDPYLDTLGGGERYTMSVAECLVENDWQVDVFWDDKVLKRKLAQRFNLSLDKVNFVKNIFSSKTSLFQRWQLTKNYDLIFYLSDGSVPFLFGRKNILHFQVPFVNLGSNHFLNKIKFGKIDQVICNSKFTRRFIDQEYGVKSRVIYPPVAVENFRPGKKKNLILAVGRFSQTLHAKKQETLIEAFKNLCKQGLKDWQLILAGGLKNKDKEYLKGLKSQAKNLPVEFWFNISFSELKDLYAQARIFWHATGCDEDEQKHPERMEHFGIVVVEAMAAGCIPVVIGKGGIPEIVTHQKDGFLWETKEELAKQTIQLIKSPEKMKKISLQSIKSSRRFSQKLFCQKIDEIIKS